jgi:hypothetical protein
LLQRTADVIAAAHGSKDAEAADVEQLLWLLQLLLLSLP